MIELGDLLVHLGERGAPRLEAPPQRREQRQPVQQVQRALEHAPAVPRQEERGQRREHRASDAQADQDARVMRQKQSPEHDRRQGAEQHPERVQYLITHRRPRRPPHAQPRGHRGDLERLTADVDHRSHEVQREPGDGDRPGPPERRPAWFVGHDEPPRRRVADAHHPVEQHDGDEQPAGLNGVGDELPQPDARDQVGEDRGAAGEQQQLELAAHAPSEIATLQPVRAAS